MYLEVKFSDGRIEKFNIGGVDIEAHYIEFGVRDGIGLKNDKFCTGYDVNDRENKNLEEHDYEWVKLQEYDFKENKMKTLTTLYPEQVKEWLKDES